MIRKETVIEGPNCINIKNEGEKVSAGLEIFRYYTQEEEQIDAEINELNKKIQQALEGQSTIFQNDVKVLKNQIENRIEKLKYINNIQEILEYKNDINNYMSKISKIIGISSQSGSYINGLVSERTALENKLNNSSKYITTDVSGVISYRIDGFEQILNIDKISSLTSEYLESLKLKKGQIAATAIGICKIVDNYECYIAISSNSSNAMKSRNW